MDLDFDWADCDVKKAPKVASPEKKKETKKVLKKPEPKAKMALKRPASKASSSQDLRQASLFRRQL